MNYSFLCTATLLAFLASSTAVAQEFRLPFEEHWFVMQGGDTINVNHHMRERSQFYGLDFMKTGGPNNRNVTQRDGSAVEDFYSWGAAVVSPVDGKIRVVHDGEPDNPIGKTDAKKAFGNYVVIEASARQFIYLCHFQNGTITVAQDAQVKSGQLLGKCGNSGNTTGPHIHMHVQDELPAYAGEGQNITFHKIQVMLSGKQFDDVDWPLIQGLFVWQKKGD